MRAKRSNCDLVADPAVRRRANQQTDGIAPNFPAGVSRPALRALLSAGVTELRHLARMREAEVAALHGMGPKALGVLRDALRAGGLGFKR